jgi:hypothetical protein
VLSCSCAKVSLTSTTLFMISSLCFSLSSHDSTTWPFTFFSTISTSYYVIVNYGTDVCTFIFFLCHVSCNTVLLFGRVSVCTEVVGTSMSQMHLPPCSSYMGTFVSLCVLPLVFFYCAPPTTKPIFGCMG